MFIQIMNAYCDYAILFHECIKKYISSDSFQKHILSLPKDDAFQYIEQQKQTKFKLYPSRNERYLLYKKLKGKDSPVTLYSYGKENIHTNKFLVILKK